MNPTECVYEALTHAEEGNPDDAAWLLLDYVKWRASRQNQTPVELDQQAREVAKLIKGMKGHPGIRDWK